MTAVVATPVAHPYADLFPVLPADELDALVESIRDHGLRHPIVLASDGRILDGRNRAAACARLGIEPESVTYDGDDLAEYVIDSNVTRRNMTTGARAMATALVLAADGRREDGRWRRGSVANHESVNSDRSWQQRLLEAGVVLDYTPAAAPEVVAGSLTLSAAFDAADRIRKSAEHEKIRDRELKRREKEEAAAEAEQHAQIVADLTQAESRYVALIEAGDLTPAAAWAAHLEDTRKEREAERQIDQGRRDTVTRIAECVRHLEGGDVEAEVFVRAFYPHEQRFLAEGMWLTRERIHAAIAYLSVLEKAVTR